MNREILKKVFVELSEYELVSILTNKEKKEYHYDDTLIVWEVETEILVEDKCIIISLHILFTEDFPLVFPKVFLSPRSYESINNLPHIDTNKFVCTFDTEVTKPNPLEPFGVTYEVIKKAKLIIEQGLKKENYQDFEEEFISYWENKYNKEKSIPLSVLLLFDEEKNSKNIRLLTLTANVGSFSYALINDENESKQFIKYLDDNAIKYSETNVFMLEDIIYKNTPPFDLTNNKSIEVISNNTSLQDFKHFINSSNYPKLVLLNRKIKNDIFYFGWFYIDIKTDLKGFRPGKFKAFDWISKIGKHRQVIRFTSEKYTFNRLMNRSIGSLKKTNYSFSFVGIGSVGSNFISLLNNFDNPEFRLIDNDILKLENIARHSLGFNYINKNKAKALGHYLKQSNPIQSVLIKEKSIVNVIQNEPDFINDSDYLFVAIGNTNIESWIGEKIKTQGITIPTFFLWVEPYLAGGHCLFIHPNSIQYSTFFNDIFFKNNVISQSSYNNDLNVLSLKEAGCQTTFVPYSSGNITSFLTSLYPFVVNIIEKRITKSSSYTWVGDLSQINDLGIKLSNNSLKKGQIILN